MYNYSNCIFLFIFPLSVIDQTEWPNCVLATVFIGGGGGHGPPLLYKTNGSISPLNLNLLPPPMFFNGQGDID